MNPNKYAKAIVAGLATGYTAFQLATGAASAGGETVTVNEWVGIAVALVITAAAVWAVPNAPTTLPK
jgi:hypothetical protein